MLRQTSAEDGVSPVVGVILMVAVTVILAAVIGSFVLDLGSNVQANPQAGVTFSQDASSSTVTIQIISMENADELDVTSANGNVATNFASSDGVGATATVDNLSDGNQITVVGTLDGKDAVIQTFTYST